MKKLFLAVLCAAVMVSGAFASGKKDSGKTLIPLISKGFQHQFWQAVKQGADKAAKEFNVEITFEGPETEQMTDKQIDMLAAAMAKNPKALGFAALDSRAATSYLQDAKQRGIPVIAFDSGVDSDIPLTTVSTDNVAAAAEAARRMGAAIGGSGKVALMVHDQTSGTGIQRRDGFINEMKAKYPNVQILEVQYGGGDHLRSTDLAKAVINANSDLKGYYGSNEGSAIGVVNAVKELGKQGQIVVVGFDSSKSLKDAIRDGTMIGAISQNPVLMGYETVRAAIRALNGETLPKNIDSGFLWADKSNLDTPEVAAVMYD
ncbi:substrate-binding domain-containing protein [Breznakiellaceae bacterium SP9]